MNRHNRWNMRIVRRAVTLAVCAAVLMACAAQTTDLPYATGDFASVTDIAPSIVQLNALNEDYLAVSQCTGTIIDTRGVILTNFHCVADSLTKEFYNPDKILEVYTTKNYATPPLFAYYAHVVATDSDADLAVLQIVRQRNGTTPLACLELPALTINTEPAAIEDAIRAVGYPGFGQYTLTVTDGKIAGLTKFGAGSVLVNGSHVALKTTTIMGHGISGGALVNSKNELIGVPFYNVPDSMGTPGSLNYAVAIDEATTIIDVARKSPIPGCENAPPVEFVRDIKSYPSSVLYGRITFMPQLGRLFSPEDATVYLFAPEYDVTDLVLEEVDAAYARGETNSDGQFKVPLTRNQYETDLGVVIVYNEQIIMRENGVNLRGPESPEYDHVYIYARGNGDQVSIESMIESIEK